MKRVLFFNMMCIGIQIESKRILDKTGIFDYTDSNHEYGRRKENMRIEIIKEDDLAVEYLLNGKGIHFKGFVYFKEENHEQSQQYKKLIKKIKRIQDERIEKEKSEYQLYLNGLLYNALRNKGNYAMVKSMIDLYHANIFSRDLLTKKLNSYLTPEGIESVLNELHKTMEKAG